MAPFDKSRTSSFSSSIVTDFVHHVFVRYRHWSVFLWRDTDDVTHCRILSPDKAEWQLIPAALCRWRRCFLAWPMFLDTLSRRRSNYSFLWVEKRSIAECFCSLLASLVCVIFFYLPRQQWLLLNRFHTEQGHCSAFRGKWRLEYNGSLYLSLTPKFKT